jgi:hypothetical protein
MSISSKIALAMSADGASFEEVHNSLEKIIEEFAIGFAEWFWINKDKFYKGERDYYLEFKELLEIYKKEKGL